MHRSLPERGEGSELLALREAIDELWERTLNYEIF